MSIPSTVNNFKRLNKRKLMQVVLVNVLTMSSMTILAAVATPLQATAALGITDFSDLVTQVTPGVARVNVTKQISQEELVKAQTVELLRQYFGNRIPIPQSQASPTIEYAYGTAFFVTDDGYLLTNHHVVTDADKITITLNDRTELDAVLVGSDERSDVAVLKIKNPTNKPYPALPMGDSDLLKVGEPVLAIGSPYGFDYSASAGIVSAKSRNITREMTVPFIQTDVALNPGNSGGPLFNQYGEVVGINSRIFSGTGSYIGLSFSIPINAALNIYEQIKQTGEVQRAYLGIFLQDIDRNLAEAYGLSKPQGALLIKVTPNSPADKAGIKNGDIITQFNNKSIVQASDVLNEINRSHPNDVFSANVLRDGQRLIINGQLQTAPRDVTSDLIDEANNTLRLGMRLRELPESDKAQLDGLGILITAMDPTGLAARSGLQVGDIITNLHQYPIRSVDDFALAIKGLPKQGVVTIEIVRQGIPAIIGLRIE